MKRNLAGLWAGLFALVVANNAASYPDKPVRMVVAFAVGGPADMAARAVGKIWAQSTGQPMVIDNRLGASGAVAAQAVLGAPADGHTLLWGSSSMTAIPMLFKNAPFEAFAQFTPASLAGEFTYGLFVHPSLQAQSVRELVTRLRARSDDVNYATSAPAEHLAAAQFAKVTGSRLTLVAYKGSAQVMPDLIAGRVHAYFMPVTAGLPPSAARASATASAYGRPTRRA